MAQPGSIQLKWGDGEYVFRLGIGEWRAIDARCKAGPDEILARLFPIAQALAKGMTVSQACAMGMSGGWRVDDMREVILQGLIGGGLGPVEAAELVRRQVDERLDFKANLALAYGVVKASLDEGVDEPLETAPGKKPAAGRARRRRPAKTAG